MNISFSFEHLFPAESRAGRHIETLVRRFQERGHQVSVVTTACDEPIDPEGIEILRLRESPGAKGHGRSDTLLGKAITKFLKAQDVDVHFCEGLTPLSAVAVKAAERAGAKTVIRVLADASGVVMGIGGDRKLAPSALKKRVSTMLRYANVAAASSPRCAELLKEYYDGETRVVEKCVDLSVCNPDRVQPTDIDMLREKFAIGDRTAIIYSREEMRAETISGTIPFMRELQAARPGIVFLIAGRVEGAAELEKEIKEAGLGDAYRLLGDLSQRDLFAAYATSALYFAPHDSRASESELLEAMAMNCPIACDASKAETTARLVEESGALVLPDGDDAAAAQALLALLDDPARLAATKEKARAAASAKDIERGLNEVQHLFEELLELPLTDFSKPLERPTPKPRKARPVEDEDDDLALDDEVESDEDEVEQDAAEESADDEGVEDDGPAAEAGTEAKAAHEDRRERRRRRRRVREHDAEPEVEETEEAPARAPARVADDRDSGEDDDLDQVDDEADDEAVDDQDGGDEGGRRRRRRRRRRRLRHEDEIAAAAEAEAGEGGATETEEPAQSEEDFLAESAKRLRELDPKLTLRDLLPFLRPPKQVYVMSMASANGQHRAGDAMFEAFKTVDQNLKVKQINIAEYLNQSYDPAEIDRLIDAEYREGRRSSLALLERIDLEPQEPANAAQNDDDDQDPEAEQPMEEQERATSPEATVDQPIPDKIFSSRLRSLILDKRPHQVILTHYLPVHYIAALKREHQLRMRIAVVITEYDLHPYWIAEGVDQYLASSEKVRYKLLRAGVPSSIIDVVGIPVHPRFDSDLDRERIRRDLGVRSNAPTILMRPGGLGTTERIMEVIKQITSVGYAFNLLVLGGRNEALVKAVNGMKSPRGVNLKAFGFVENIHEVMGVADLLITRAVGHTVAEAFASGLPMLLIRPETMAEERTVDWFVERGVAMKAHDSLDLEWLLTDLLRQQGRTLREMRNRTMGSGRPRSGAAALGVDKICRLLN
ncbi:MAG: glycosyltransferase [Planctomycetes bacterium]|nr:glycosyltransferase [Planctomycetota bacterium]